MELTQCCHGHTSMWRASTWRDVRRECYSEVGGKGETRPNTSSQTPCHGATALRVKQTKRAAPQHKVRVAAQEKWRELA